MLARLKNLFPRKTEIPPIVLELKTAQARKGGSGEEHTN